MVWRGDDTPGASGPLEAPNWTPDGRWLIFNQDGLLYRVPAGGGAPAERIDTGGVTTANNDHVLSPDGRTVYLSAGDGHIYAVPLPAEGGGDGGGSGDGGDSGDGGSTDRPPVAARRVTNDHPGPFRHFLHGVSPDGALLAYVGVEPHGGDEWGYRNIFTVPAAGGADVRLTDSPAPADGPEFSADGKWIYFNSEHGAEQPGHAQLFRMRADGTGLTRLTDDERVNWFPHVSPDGARILYLSYPPGTEGHPADRDVVIRLIAADGTGRRDLLALRGGQGTLNVNSWAPDSRRFAYVEY